MRSHIKIGRIFGVRIGLHYSWFLIALLIVFSLSGEYRLKYPNWSHGLVLALSITTAFLFFLSLLLHELSHSLMAKAHGLSVREITLFALGGVASIEQDATNARSEFMIAVVGPLTSAGIGLTCLAVAHALVGSATLGPLRALLLWLGYINLGLAAFNLIPGYPMDGGRILRAILWWKTGSLDRSTRIAARTGQIVAIVFIALGIVGYFTGGGLGGLWIAFIGWFILQAARESYIEIGLKRSLLGVRVSDVMTRECPTVDSQMSLQTFVEEQLLPTGRRFFIVTEAGRVAGLITPHEVKHVDRALWPVTRLDFAMRPLSKLRAITPNSPLIKALEVMAREELNQLPVIVDGYLEGILSREKIISYLQTRIELQGDDRVLLPAGKH